MKKLGLVLSFLVCAAAGALAAGGAPGLGGAITRSDLFKKFFTWDQAGNVNLSPGSTITAAKFDSTAVGGADGFICDNRANIGWNNSGTHFTIDGSADVNLFSSNGAAGFYISTTASGFDGIAISNAGARLALSGAGVDDYLSSDGTNVILGRALGTSVNSFIANNLSAATLSLTGKANIGPNGTTCTLNGSTPSTCTATVTAGAICTCSNVGATALIAASGCATSLTTTTLTITGAAAATNVVNIICNK